MPRIKKGVSLVKFRDEVKVPDDIGAGAVYDIAFQRVIILCKSVIVAAIMLLHRLRKHLPRLVDGEIAAVLFHIVNGADDKIIGVCRRFRKIILLHTAINTDLITVFLSQTGNLRAI